MEEIEDIIKRITGEKEMIQKASINIEMDSKGVEVSASGRLVDITFALHNGIIAVLDNFANDKEAKLELLKLITNCVIDKVNNK